MSDCLLIMPSSMSLTVEGDEGRVELISISEKTDEDGRLAPNDHVPSFGSFGMPNISTSAESDTPMVESTSVSEPAKRKGSKSIVPSYNLMGN